MRDSLSVIIAPDSFKGSATARNAADAIAQGWRRIRPQDSLTLLPQADGGEGTLDAIESAVSNTRRHSVGPVAGPNGRPTPGEWLELPDHVAVVELAQCSGLTLSRHPDPMHSTTRGLGEVIRAVLAADVRSLVIALGGSASTDGGAGALAALGLHLFDNDGRILEDGGEALNNLARVDNAMIPPPPGGVTLLIDVTAPLLGPTGAAAVFGPQKGAGASDVMMLEGGLSTLARRLGGDPAAPGSGAAGGTAYGFTTMWNARLELGATYIQRLTRIDTLMGSADIVLTGEGRFDATSSTGKVVGELVTLALRRNVAVGIIAGMVEVETPHWTCSLSTIAGSAEASQADPLRYLELAGQAAARHFSAVN